MVFYGWGALDGQNIDTWMQDKMNIIYAHIHYLANAYPNKNITYQLVDVKDDYLDSLSYFYTKYPEMIPDNVHIQFIQHGSRSENFYSIQKQSRGHDTFWEFSSDETILQETKQFKSHTMSDIERSKRPTTISIYV